MPKLGGAKPTATIPSATNPTPKSSRRPKGSFRAHRVSTSKIASPATFRIRASVREIRASAATSRPQPRRFSKIGSKPGARRLTVRMMLELPELARRSGEQHRGAVVGERRGQDEEDP